MLYHLKDIKCTNIKVQTTKITSNKNALFSAFMYQIIEAEQRFDLYVFKGETERADHV